MLSLPKILFTLALIAIVFFGAKAISRRVGGAAAKVRKSAAKPKATAKPSSEVETVDLTKCPVCDSFVAADASHCGRADCPYPR